MAGIGSLSRLSSRLNVEKDAGRNPSKAAAIADDYAERLETQVVDELADAVAFLNPGNVNQPWAFGFGQVETRSGKVNFQHFPHFISGSLQVSTELPHSSLGYACFNRQGGHPGKGETHCILRWMAPNTGKYDISTDIKVPSPSSDGVTLSITDKDGTVMKKWKVK